MTVAEWVRQALREAFRAAVMEREHVIARITSFDVAFDALPGVTPLRVSRP